MPGRFFNMRDTMDMVPLVRLISMSKTLESYIYHLTVMSLIHDHLSSVYRLELTQFIFIISISLSISITPSLSLQGVSKRMQVLSATWFAFCRAGLV
jgi:hypothetical protein